MCKFNVALLCFCSLLISSLSYGVDYGTPVEDSSFAVFLFFDKEVSNASIDEELSKVLTEKDMLDLAEMGCIEKKPEVEVWVSPILVPLITTAATRIFEKYQDAKLDRLKKLKKESTNEYSKTIYVNSTELKTLKCAALIRYTSKKDSEEINKGLFSVIKFDHKLNAAGNTKGFTFTPKYFIANNATVKTLTNKKQPSSAKISTAIAVTLKAITQDENKLPSISPLGAASVGLSKVPLNGTDKCAEASTCEESDLIPHIDVDTTIALSIGVSEIGYVGIDFDKREAEINAIKEAYGSALKESITELLKDK